MHRLPSLSTITRFRLAALLLCAKNVLLPSALLVLLYAMITHDYQSTWLGVTLAVMTLISGLLQWFLATRTGCPLCLTPVLAKKTCVTHRSARSFLGSHRMRVALAILSRNAFLCPYCNESTALEVRESRRHHRNRKTRS